MGMCKFEIAFVVTKNNKFLSNTFKDVLVQFLINDVTKRQMSLLFNTKSSQRATLTVPAEECIGVGKEINVSI